MMPSGTTPPPKILIVDDRHENRVALEAILAELDVDVISAASGNEALGHLLEHDFAVVLMDVQMPEMDGFEVVEVMHRNRRTRNVPVVFVTAISTEHKFVARGYEAGAVDYLFKPIDPEILRSKVRVFVELDVKTRLLEERNAQLEELAAKLRDISLTDPLTGLNNRRFLVETVDSELAVARRLHADRRSSRLREAVNTDVGFLMVDIDHFKQINDDHGHDAGDQVLVELSSRLRDCVRETDSIVRWGGEEFLALLRRSEPDGLAVVAERIRTQVAAVGFAITQGHQIHVTCSVGFCRYPAPEDESFRWQEVVAIADQALYLAKERGRNTWVGVEILTPPSPPRERSFLDSDLERAERAGQVRLVTRSG